MGRKKGATYFEAGERIIPLDYYRFKSGEGKKVTFNGRKLFYGGFFSHNPNRILI
jgi:hypothetical protein